MNVNQSLTGNWKLNLKKSTVQCDLLNAMGRKYWERVCIDKADEDFCLYHFVKKLETGDVHYFEKFVIIYLDSLVLKLLTKILPVEFDKVRYSHKLIANNKEVNHPDDEKRFGVCTSRTSWEKIDNKEGFTIRWYIPSGLLKVFHHVNEKGELNMEMEMTTKKKEVVKAIKIYDRLDFTEEQKKRIEEKPYKSDLIK